MSLINYSSLLIAVGVTGSALATTLFTTWLTTRSESFLLTWAIGAVLVVAGAVSFGIYSAQYNALWLAATSYIVLAYGLAIFWGAARQFRRHRHPLRVVVLQSVLATAVIGVPFLAGYSGTGAAIANLVMAVLLAATAREYWSCRKDAPTPLLILTVLHAMVAVTFILCSGMILLESPLVLEHPPRNWAEDVNAMVSLIAISGIGATALALNQSRLALRHRCESMTDALTGLVNRRALSGAYGELELPLQAAVVVFDLDRFKAINDQHGHSVGDLVIQHFTQVLQASLRPADTAARIGGEEFVLVLPGCNEDLARELAERVRMRFAGQPLLTEGGSLFCTVSAGVAATGPHLATLNAMLKRADEALYKAKREGGRNCVRAYGDMFAPGVGVHGRPQLQMPTSTDCQCSQPDGG